MPRGDKVRKIVSELKGFEKEIIPYRRNFNFPIRDPDENLDLLEDDLEFRDWKNGVYKRSPANVYSGRFFEELAVSMKGGRINDDIHTIYEQYKVKPDIFYGEDKWAEVKSCVTSSPQKFEREQLAKFAYWLINNTPKIDFIFFQHCVDGIQRNYEGREDLIDKLRSNVLFSFSVPIQVPMQFFINEEKSKFNQKEYPTDGSGSRGYGDKSILSISSTFLWEMIGSPEETLDKLGFDSKDFNFERYTIKNLKVNRRKITEFPFLHVKNRNGVYESWLHEERSKLEELAQSYVEQEKQRCKEQEQEGEVEGFPWESEDEEELF